MNKKITYQKPKIIAEIGCNHMGQVEIAKELILLAKDAGAKYVKFQKRHPKSLLTQEQYESCHPNQHHSYGITYGEHREFLELDLKQNQILKNFCDQQNMIYSTSVWDVISAKEIISLSPSFIKVPSACNNNFEMLEILRDEYDGQLQLSVGMTTKNEIEEIVSFFEFKDKARTHLLIYSCTSGYPVKPSEVSLLEILWLREHFGERVSEIGFSGHHLGISLDIAAYTLGASWIERHFTKDRTWKGTDHAASLEPGGLQKLIRDLNSTYEALKYKEEDILEVEKIQREKLKYRK